MSKPRWMFEWVNKNEWKDAGQAEHENSRASRFKAERRGTSQPMPGCRRRIPDNIKRNETSFAAQILGSATKAEILKEVTKWEVKISKRKYVDKNEKQWWWGASINIIMRWNHNIIIYQCWKWSYRAKLINQNMMWSGINQWSLIVEKYDEVNLLVVPKQGKGGGLMTRKVKQNYCQCDVTLPDCVVSL